MHELDEGLLVAARDRFTDTARRFAERIERAQLEVSLATVRSRVAIHAVMELGERLRKGLRGRRDELVKGARAFYLHLARRVDVRASDASENVTVRHGPDDSLRVEVFRLLSDDLPMRVVSELHLSVSGRSRVVTVGQVLGPEFAVVDFTSALPARIDDGGNLTLQVEPGEHVVRLTARALGEPDTFAAAPATRCRTGPRKRARSTR